MKHGSALILIFVLASTAFPADRGFTVTSGMATMAGGNAGDYRPGFNIGGSLYGLITPSVGLGGESRFNVWAIKAPLGYDLHLSLRCFEFYLTPLFFIPVNPSIKFVLQPGIGFYNSLSTVRYGWSTESAESIFDGNAAISLQGQVIFQGIIAQPAFKLAFCESETLSWWNFNLGYQREF